MSSLGTMYWGLYYTYKYTNTFERIIQLMQPPSLPTTKRSGSSCQIKPLHQKMPPITPCSQTAEEMLQPFICTDVTRYSCFACPLYHPPLLLTRLVVVSLHHVQSTQLLSVPGVQKPDVAFVVKPVVLPVDASHIDALHLDTLNLV
jgi:hypothetical protein